MDDEKMSKLTKIGTWWFVYRGERATYGATFKTDPLQRLPIYAFNKKKDHIDLCPKCGKRLPSNYCAFCGVVEGS